MRFPISRKNFAPAIIENCVVYLRRVVGFLLFFPPPAHNPKWVFPTTQQHMQATFGAFALLLCRKMRNAGCPGSLRGVLRRVPSKHPLVERVCENPHSIPFTLSMYNFGYRSSNHCSLKFIGKLVLCS